MTSDPEKQALDQARRLSEDPHAAERVAGRADARAQRFSGRLGDAVEDIQALARLVRARVGGAYPRLPARSLVAAIGALLYFLMPMDAVPDFIVALGFVDDLAVIARVVHYLRRDLADFRAWESEQGGVPSDRENE